MHVRSFWEGNKAFVCLKKISLVDGTDCSQFCTVTERQPIDLQQDRD